MDLFAAWARLVCRHRWRVLGCSVLLLAGAVFALVRGGNLSTGVIEGIESGRGAAWIEEGLGRPAGSTFTILFTSPTLKADQPEFQDEMRRALAPLSADEHVLAVEIPADVPAQLAAEWISTNGHRALAHVTLRDPFQAAALAYPRLRELVRSDRLQILHTGFLAFKHTLDRVLEKDLLRAELVSIPLALIVLLVVFATLVAALLPVGVGGLAVVGGVAAVMLLAHVTDMAQYTVNVVTLIGLGVAIDYSLFIVSRYKEELAAGASVEGAIERAVATTGRAVAFSGLAVGIGLSGLLFFPRSYLFAMGLAGAIVVALAVICALTFLPALLAVLGARIHAGHVPFALAGPKGTWHRIAQAVMKRPVAVLVPTLALVVIIGAPFLRLRMAAADVRVLPQDTEARQGADILQQEFPAEAGNKVIVAVRFPDAHPLTPARITALYELSRRIARVPGVQKVQSVVDLDPRMELEAYQSVYAMPASLMPAGIGLAQKMSVGGPIVVLAAITAGAPDSDQARNVVRELRKDRQVGDGTLLVTGQTANDLDSQAFIVGHAPQAVAFVMAMTYLILFLLLRSVLLPLKAVVMNLLSIAGSFGALVWIFQEGHLSWLLRFEPGPIEPTLPVLLFCTLFGLSMDYEVLLLTRMQEEYVRTGDNTHAVAEGLERTGRLITSAAAIMVSVFAAFSLAHVIMVKAMGLGMALAVALDATAVRILIVPATMRLFGKANWWAPGFLRKKRA